VHSIQGALLVAAGMYIYMHIHTYIHTYIHTFIHIREREREKDRQSERESARALLASAANECTAYTECFCRSGEV
jgi:hypothetical protein